MNMVTGYDWFAEALGRYPRVAIAGGPKSGKTRLSKRVTDRPVVHTDDTISQRLGWSEASQHVCDEVNARVGPLVVEGVAVPRALRKGMRIDAVIWLSGAHWHLNEGQKRMAQGCLTVFQEWRDAHPHVPIICPPQAPSMETAT